MLNNAAVVVKLEYTSNTNGFQLISVVVISLFDDNNCCHKGYPLINGTNGKINTFLIGILLDINNQKMPLNSKLTTLLNHPLLYIVLPLL